MIDRPHGWALQPYNWFDIAAPCRDKVTLLLHPYLEVSEVGALRRCCRPRHDALPAAEVDIQGIHGTTSSHRSSGTSAEAGEQSSPSDSSASSTVQRAVSMRVLRPRRIRTSKAGKKGSAYTSSDHHIWLNGTAKLRWDRLKRGGTRAPSAAATAGHAEAPKRRSKLA